MPAIVPPARYGRFPAPPAPSDPPTARDIAMAAAYELNCTNAYCKQCPAYQPKWHSSLAGDGGARDVHVAETALYKYAILIAAAPQPGGSSSLRVSVACLTSFVASEAPPPWFAQALEHAIRPVRDDIANLTNDMQAMKKDMEAVKSEVSLINKRQANTQRCAALVSPRSMSRLGIIITATCFKAYNRTVQPGRAIPFEEVPFPDGTRPWGMMVNVGLFSLWTSCSYYSARRGQNEPLPELTSLEAVRTLSSRQSLEYHEGYYPEEAAPEDSMMREKAILLAIGVEPA